MRKPQTYRKPDFSVLRRGYEGHYCYLDGHSVTIARQDRQLGLCLG
ncbi:MULTISPECIES: hypothetical protein [Providencia]|uniref:Uncharacterized protein n=1 Tax=Providencia huaxiensis TaxID=2027290 RepID=A0ABU2J1G4_9GAMM|nr:MULTISPECIES: hypothetical protein [Providencia]MDT0134454.1 hypothetical protein [Providencia huaxiensis]MDT1980859.1 hypothetical protein [Providencia huaxiensis]